MAAQQCSCVIGRGMREPPANFGSTADYGVGWGAGGIKSQEASSGLSGLFQQSGTITVTSSADYLYPSGGYELRPGAPVLSKMLPIFRNLQHTTISVVGY